MAANLSGPGFGTAGAPAAGYRPLLGRREQDQGGIPAGASQGHWLNNQQYQEYLNLLKQRVQAQQVITRPVSMGQVPPKAITTGGAGLAPYSVAVPGYGHVAGPAPAGKAGGYGGQSKPHPALSPRP